MLCSKAFLHLKIFLLGLFGCFSSCSGFRFGLRQFTIDIDELICEHLVVVEKRSVRWILFNQHLLGLDAVIFAIGTRCLISALCGDSRFFVKFKNLLRRGRTIGSTSLRPNASDCRPSSVSLLNCQRGFFLLSLHLLFALLDFFAEAS